MKKRILIIESDRIVLCAMVKIAMAAEYLPLGVLFGESSPIGDGILVTKDPEELIRFAQGFKPDKVLIEHDFRFGAHLAGQYFVNRLGWAREILVGTSIVHAQDYCGKKFFGKIHVEEANMKPVFLNILAA